MIVVFCFFFHPHVERFIHHDETHLVAEVEKLGCGRVMGCTYAIASHFFQKLELTLQGAGIDRGAETAEIVVVANAQNLQMLAVQEKSLRAVECERSDSKCRHRRSAYHASSFDG